MPPPDRGPELPSHRVAAGIRQRCEAGEWKSGQRLPPVSELATEYGVARRTVMKALRELEADELITIVANWGTFRK